MVYQHAPSYQRVSADEPNIELDRRRQQASVCKEVARLCRTWRIGYHYFKWLNISLADNLTNFMPNPY